MSGREAGSAVNRPVVRLLGEFSLETSTGRVQFPARKVEALFAYLLLAQRQTPRGQLCSAIWPDVDEETGRRNLRTALWRLRKVLQTVPQCRLEANGAAVQLRCDQVEIDVVRFASLVESLQKVSPGKQFDVMNEALELYRGDLLEAFLDDWCDGFRKRSRGLYVRLLRHAVNGYKTLGDFRRAIAHAQTLVQLDPLDEDAHRELMVLYHLAGDKDAALFQFGNLRMALGKELAVQPSRETIELWEFIRSHGQRTFPAGVLTRSQDSSSRLPSHIPMLGRDAHASTLLQFTGEVAKGAGRVVVVSGEAGVGKSTLVEVLAAEAGLRGFEVLQGQCPDLQDPSPYQVFIQALWPRITSAQRHGALSPPLAALMQLLGFRGDNPESTVVSSSGAYDSAIVNETLLSVLTAEGYVSRPTVLILEDMQRADKASANLLAVLLARVKSSSLLTLVTVRSGEPSAIPLRSHLLANGAYEVDLEPLAEKDVADLMRAVLGSKKVPHEVVRYVFARTGGIPLLALEFLKYLRTEGFLIHDPYGAWTLDPKVYRMGSAGLPPRINELIRRRLDLTDATSKRILTAAAVWGTEIDFDLLQELTGLSENNLTESIEQLLTGRLLRSTSSGFKFSHESIRLAAISVSSKVQLRSLHSRAISLLEALRPWCTEELSWHFEESGDLERAVAYANASGDKARAVHANADAAEWYTKALSMLDGLPKSRVSSLKRAEILLKRREVRELLGERRGQAADIDEIRSLATSLRDSRLSAEACCLQAGLLTRSHMSQRALEEIKRAIDLFRSIRDSEGEARAHETAGLVYMNIRGYDLALVEFKGAYSLFRQSKDRRGEARGLAHIGTILGFQNRNLAAIRYFDRAEVLLTELGDDRSLAITRLQRGTLYRFLGKADVSESLLLSGLEKMERIGDRVGEARALSQLACTHAVMGRLREAVHESERALRIAQRAKDIRAEIVILNNASYGVFRLVGAFRRAERYVERAMRLVLEAGGLENAATYADTMASLMLERCSFRAALRWSKLSESLAKTSVIRRTWIGVDIRFRLGKALAETGQPSVGLRLLRSARAELAASSESAYELLVVTELARLHLSRGDLSKGINFAKDMDSLLRRVNGVEQIQRVHWVRHEVLRAAGRHSSAGRALRQAYEAMLSQALVLKGPMRRQFLEMELNSRIAHAAAAAGLSPSISAKTPGPGFHAEKLLLKSSGFGQMKRRLVRKDDSRTTRRRYELIRLLKNSLPLQRRLTKVSVRTSGSGPVLSN